METDPDFEPAGPFSFGPDDFESDESNMQARYEASWRIFRDMAAAHGAPALRNWVADVTSAPATVTTEELVVSAQTALDENLAERLE